MKNDRGLTTALRTVIHTDNGANLSTKTLLIVLGGYDGQPIYAWDIAPLDLMEGPQPQPEGKKTQQLRRWFEQCFSVQLPSTGDWGHCDASMIPGIKHVLYFVILENDFILKKNGKTIVLAIVFRISQS
jgi:hypothetical protein